METNREKGRPFQERAAAYIREFHMLKNGDTVIVGVSGGADSVCLLRVLCLLREELGLTLHAAHVNHGIRESAGRDEAFVQELCQSEGVTLHTCTADIPALAEEKRVSLEEAGREVRYQFFDRIAEKTGASRIAVAHHANDQAETILFHLCRGSGVQGVAGMQPVRGRIIRPLLFAGRAEIEEFLAGQGLSYMTDETNSDTAYARNYLRNEILPQLERRICSGSTEHIAQTGEMVQEALSYLSGQIDEAFAACVCSGGKEQTGVPQSLSLSLERLWELHPYMQKEVLRRALYEVSGSRKDIARVHIDALCRLGRLQTGRSIQLPYGVVVKKSYDTLRFGRQCAEAAEAAKISGKLPYRIAKEELLSPREFQLPDGKIMRMCAVSYEKNTEVPRKACTKWLDYDKIETFLEIRAPREGDFFYFSDKNKKSVKQYMINEKIPKEERDRQVLVTEGDHMLYFCGRRISNYYKINGQTTRILEITVTGG
jgi:tRNA(Ile)-lysidine synthase